jgi:hypothetical protein
MDAVKTFLQGEQWSYEEHPGGGALRLRFKGESGEWVVLVQEVGQEGGKVVVYSMPANVVPPAARAAAGEAVARLNFGMILGNWEIDYDSGEVRYKTSADFRGEGVGVGAIKHLVYTNVLMVDRYLPALLAVAFGGRAPKEAVEAIDAEPADA